MAQEAQWTQLAGILGYFWSASTLCRKKMRQIQRVIAPTSVDEFDNCS